MMYECRRRRDHASPRGVSSYGEWIHWAMINPDDVGVPDFLIRIVEDLALISDLSIDELYDLIGFQLGRQLTVRDIDVAVDWLSSRSGKPWAPLEFGTQINVRQMGRLGPLIASCGTVGDALHLFHRYHRLLHPFLDIDFKKVGKRLAFRVPAQAGIPSPRWRAELVIGGLPYWVQRFVKKELPLHRVWFRHPAPDYLEQYHAHFGCEVLFEQSWDCVWTDTACLNFKIKTYSPAFHATVLTEAEAELRASLSFSHRVKSSIRAKLAEDCGIEELAKILVCSERTLQRKLAEEGTSVKKLKQEVKCEEAILLLDETSLSVEQIAYKLGYDQRSSFGTAFQQWTGVSPLKWRAKWKSPKIVEPKQG